MIPAPMEVVLAVLFPVPDEPFGVGDHLAVIRDIRMHGVNALNAQGMFEFHPGSSDWARYWGWSGPKNSPTVSTSTSMLNAFLWLRYVWTTSCLSWCVSHWNTWGRMAILQGVSNTGNCCRHFLVTRLCHCSLERRAFPRIIYSSGIAT